MGNLLPMLFFLSLANALRQFLGRFEVAMMHRLSRLQRTYGIDVQRIVAGLLLEMRLDFHMLAWFANMILRH